MTDAVAFVGAVLLVALTFAFLRTYRKRKQ
jgi:hypothetical protein